MKTFTSHKGFTLIELLVVVAIIGLLAATILASLGQARGKAKLARAQSEISSMRAAAELYASSNATGYTGVFGDTASGMKNLVDSVTTAANGAIVSGDNDDSWHSLQPLVHQHTVLTTLVTQVQNLPELMEQGIMCVNK